MNRIIFDPGKGHIMAYILPPDEVPLYYEEFGQGKTLLLIHGGAASTRFWKKQIPVFSKHFHVIAMDLRGHGNSGKTAEGHNLTQYGRDLKTILDTLDLDRVVIVGWSLGSSVAMSYFEQFGLKRLAGLVNVDQRPYRFTSEKGLQELVNVVRTSKFRAHWRRLESFLHTPQSEDNLRWMACEMMKTPTDVYLSVIRDSFQYDFRPLLSGLNIPALICTASNGLIEPDQAQWMVGEMPQARVVEFDECGHMLFWEQPDKFNREVTSFVHEVI